MVQPLWRTVWRFLKKLKIESLHDPAISLLSMYLEKPLVSGCFSLAVAKNRMDKALGFFTLDLFRPEEVPVAISNSMS